MHDNDNNKDVVATRTAHQHARSLYWGKKQKHGPKKEMVYLHVWKTYLCYYCFVFSMICFVLCLSFIMSFYVFHYVSPYPTVELS